MVARFRSVSSVRRPMLADADVYAAKNIRLLRIGPFTPSLAESSCKSLFSIFVSGILM